MSTHDESTEPPANLDRILQVIRAEITGRRPPGVPEGRVWVEGKDDEGLTILRVECDGRVFEMHVPDLKSLAAMLGPPLKDRRPPEALPLPYVPRTARRRDVLERTAAPGKTLSFLRAGADAQELATVEAVRGQHLAGALFTLRGPTFAEQGMEYKPYNEDGVFLRVRAGSEDGTQAEIVTVAVADQAGGEGSVEGEHGAGSHAALAAFARSIEAVERGADPEESLRQAMADANAAVRDLGVGAVSTLTGVVVVAQTDAGGARTIEAFAASVGDSRVIHADSSGAVKAKTALHNLGSLVAAGLVDGTPPAMAMSFASVLTRGLGGENEEPDLYHWSLEPGDRLVLCTDGLGDAREFEDMPAGTWHSDFCAEDQARIAARAASAADGVQALIGYALDQMAEQNGKPDNIGVAVVEVLGR